MNDNNATSTLLFPPSFMWGSATSSHQVEGNNCLNDWWAFEQQPGRIRNGVTSGDACNQYELYPQDIALLQQLNQNAYRFSLEWSRIEPQAGVFDRQAIAHYRDILEKLHSHNIEPIVTIHHFTNPLWLTAQGGWETSAAIHYFSRFVELLVKEYGDLVRYWVTINEPMVYGVMGYLLGYWTPAKIAPVQAFTCVANLLRAHVAAYQILHKHSRRSPMVGIAHNMRIFDPANANSWFDRKIAALQDYVFNQVVLTTLKEGRLHLPLGMDAITTEHNCFDFIGLNYYARDLVAFDLKEPTTFFGRNFPAPGSEVSLFGWEIYAEGLYRCCKRLATYGCPILITENGLPDETDAQRPRVLLDHLVALHRAIAEGVDVRGYFHWSFIDNFEWAEGYATPFGLVAIDFKTQTRTIKASGELYAEICQKGAITPQMRASVKGAISAPSHNLNLYVKKGFYANSNAFTSN